MWEDNIRMDLREIESKAVDWMHLAQDRDQRGGSLVNMVMTEPSGSIKAGNLTS